MSAVFQTLRRRLAGRDPYDIAAIVLLVGLAALVVATFGSYAISNDEEVQQRYGELIVRYFASGFTDRSLFALDNLYLYGGLFDVVSVLAGRLVPLDPYALRHLLCGLIGIGGIAATWATARLVAGPRAGVFAAGALAVCGCWYGAMFNHTKDIPFAAAMMAAVYFLCRARRDLPRPHARDVLLFGLCAGAALGIRSLGLLLIGYTALAFAMTALQSPAPLRERVRGFSMSVIAFMPAFVIAYVLMVVAWPWSALSPLNPVRGLIDFAHFNYQINTILDGHVYTMGNVPRWYVPTYLLIKLPLVMLAGAGVAVALLVTRIEAVPARLRQETTLLAAIAVFPVLCEVIDRGPAFTGMRHFLFVVPVFAVLAGIGYDRLIVLLDRGHIIAGEVARAAVCALLLWNGAMLVRLHPYEYLYFNPLVGGLAGAENRYATDYWVSIMPEAVENLEAYVAQIDRAGHHTQRYTVAVCGERLPFEKEANSRLQWTADWKSAEFFIAPTHMQCDRALDGEVIASIGRLGAQIGVVKDRRYLVQPALARGR